jgi:hypothetical protein
MNDTTTAKSDSAAGLLDEIKTKAHHQDAQCAAAYREGLKDAAGFMGLASAMSDKFPQKKELQERFSRYVHGDFGG